MALWRRRGTDAGGRTGAATPGTRAWLTVTAREVAPASILGEVVAQTRLRHGETLSFDGRSAAIAVTGHSYMGEHVAGAPLALRERDRDRLIATIQALHRHPDVIDLTFETHVGGADDVHTEQSLTHTDLVEHVAADRLVSGVRYLTD